MDGEAAVDLLHPEPGFLATIEQFCLFLSTIRRQIPRLHYALPVFAAFCRAEPVIGEDLGHLDAELDELLQALGQSTDEDWFRLTSAVKAEGPERYRRAHYRGRTFDRICIEAVASDELEAFVGDLGLGRGAKHVDVYGPLLDRIRAALRMAQDKGTPLQQVVRPHHSPPALTEF